MRRYELMLVLRPDAPDERASAVIDRTTRYVVASGGQIVKVGPAPNRRGTSVRFKPDHQIFGDKLRWRPAVSVVVPFYNAHEYWPETLDRWYSEGLERKVGYPASMAVSEPLNGGAGDWRPPSPTASPGGSR